MTNLGRFPVALFTEAAKKEQDSKDDHKGWVSETLANPAPKGKRNDTLASLAGYFAMTGVGPVVATEILQNWNKKNFPPLETEEVERSVLSVYKTANKRSTGPPKKQSAPGEETFGLMGFGNYMSSFYNNEQKWLVKDWLPASTIGMLVAPPETYKTWMQLDLAVSVASGCPFLGKYPVLDDGPVWIIQQEDFAGQTVDRLSLIIHNRLGISPSGDEIELPPELPIAVHVDRKLRFDDKEVMDSFTRQVAKHKPRLVLIDPLYSTVDTDDYMKAAAGQMFVLKDLRDKYGTTFVIAHHTNKKTGSDTDRQGAWGSQFLNAFLETGWQLRKDGDCIRVKRHFKSFAAPPDINLKFDIDSETSYTYIVNEVTKKVPKKEKDALREEIGEAPAKKEEKPKIVTVSNDADIRLQKLLTTNKQMSIYEIAKHMQMKLEDARVFVDDMVDKGRVLKNRHQYKWNKE